MARFWEFSQNNSGGSFDIDDEKGIGPRVWVEAENLGDAIARSRAIGIYFNGVEDGMDCECCGDRWSEPWSEDGKPTAELNQEYDFNWHDTVFIHRMDGTIERIKAKVAAQPPLIGRFRS